SPGVDGIPAGYSNPDSTGAPVAAEHSNTSCIGPDLPHGWQAMHDAVNGGAMDGFYRAATAGGADGRRALLWYDARDLPFYSWLYSTFAISDRFFSSVLGPTWPNRDYLYAATSDGVKE